MQEENEAAISQTGALQIRGPPLDMKEPKGQKKGNVMSCVAAHPDPVIASPGIFWVVDKSGGQIFPGWWTNFSWMVDKSPSEQIIICPARNQLCKEVMKNV